MTPREPVGAHCVTFHGWFTIWDSLKHRLPVKTTESGRRDHSLVFKISRWSEAQEVAPFWL